MSFVHLHAHSEYSMLDGASRIGDMFEAAADQGMPACAITDHGVMYGALEFYKKGIKSGVKPIIGMEGYLFAGDRREKPPQKEHSERVFHTTLLAMNNTGYKNLVKISSKAWLQGFHYWPRTDHELIAEYADGLICLSGCLSAQIPKAIVAGDLKGARTLAAQYRELFGDRFYLELQDHGIAVQAPLNDELVKIGEEMGIPWVCTNDSHYTYKSEAPAHEVLLCVNTGAVLSDPNRFKFDSHEFYLKTPAEMQKQFSRWPGACETTLDVAERCNVTIDMGNLLLPIYEVVPGRTPTKEELDDHLTKLVHEGVARRYGGPSAVTTERAQYELGVIKDMGFAGYFLVVQDFVNWSKEQGIRVGPGRGSAAGSIVSYALGITELDPIRYNLMFERFLNPERVEMPDIDIDFDERRRGDVIRYVSEKYGDDHVAQIVTYGTIKGKQAIKDAARVLGFPYQDGDRLTKMYPPLIMGRDAGLRTALKDAPELAQAYAAGGAAKEIIDVAIGIENLKRSAGIHAAGVVIGRDPLDEHVPLKRGDHGEVVTQFDMKGVTDLGLLKMDFLGLRNLTVIDLTRDYIKANKGQDVDVDDLDFTDDNVYKMLRKGDSDGIFQLESDGMRRLLAQLKPDSFEHIMALIALYRPGPMEQIPSYIERKNDPSKIEFLHPLLEEITEETYGILVYQEQIVLLLQKLAGYTPGRADMVRKAIGKKDRDLMAAEEPRFLEGCGEKGMAQADAKKLWALIQPFADYSFNRAHSACYAYIAYQTAWLKTHHPVEYMAALLTSVKDRKDDKPKYLAMARKMGIEVTLPDVNTSDRDFTPVGETIRFGLSAVRGVGEGVVERIIEARKTKGAFTSFHDFARKVDYSCLNRKTVESLIWAGAFSRLGQTYKGLIEAHENICGAIIDQRKQLDLGQDSLFSSLSGGTDEPTIDSPIGIDEYPRDILNSKEKEMLGVYVSDHPLLGVEGLLARICDCSLAQLSDRPPGEVVTVGGIVSGLTKRVTRNGGIMLLLTIEDLSGAAVEVLVFNKVYETYSKVFRIDAIVQVKGRVDRDARDDSVKVIAMEAAEPNLATNRPLEIKLAVARCTERVVHSIKGVLAEHPGSTPVFLHLKKDAATTVLKLSSEFCVDTTRGLHAELKALLGPDAV